MSESEAAAGGGGEEKYRFLPMASIGRIMRRRGTMRRAAREKGNIAKDAQEYMQECVSEFISYITIEANHQCMKENRQNITGGDIIRSMDTLGFKEYVEPLKIYLRNYRENHGEEKYRFLPMASIGCFMRRSTMHGAARENGNITKDAQEYIQECVSEFINYITIEAIHQCTKDKRKNITGGDIIQSMDTLGFTEYVEPLKIYLRNYREAATKGSTNFFDENGKRQKVLNGDPASSFDGKYD